MFGPLHFDRSIGPPLQLSNGHCFVSARFTWFHVVPKSSCSFSTVFLHEFFGMPSLLAPWGFHSRDRWVMLVVGSLSPAWSVFTSPRWRSSTATTPLGCTAAYCWWQSGVGRQSSLLVSRTDFTLALNILTFVHIEMNFDPHIGIKMEKTACALVHLASTSSSVLPVAVIRPTNNNNWRTYTAQFPWRDCQLGIATIDRTKITKSQIWVASYVMKNIKT